VQATYILEKYGPGIIKAIDLNVGNIEIARQEAERMGTKGIVFQVDDAHALSSIEDNSVDIVINIESAFHYSDKPSFLRQVNRVLKPGGSFVIADILSRNTRSNALKDIWNKKMSYHHWVLSSYETELPLAGFFGVSISDITKQVIHIFRSYRRWLGDMKRKHFFDDLMLKIFYTVNARLNIYLLRTSKQYCVFVGRKPE
jgi:ubiquinone/menaquinone biosynthesis C-methylase UbiE